MGNFMRRTLAFILGMIFMVVVLVGGIAGGAYWAFKNLTIGQLNITQEDSEMSSWTIEDLTSFILDMTKDPSSITLKMFEERGFSIEKLLNLDFSNANPQDVESLKSIAFASLSGPTGLNEVGMGVVFLLLPKNEDTGSYPIFSEGARARLRQFTLGDLVYNDESGNVGALNVLRSMQLGCILSGTFTETYVDGEYSYYSDDKGLNLLGGIQLGLVTDLMEGVQPDIGYEIMEGYLQNLKTKSIKEIFASFGATDDDTYNQNLEKLSLLGDVKLEDSFVWNEENQVYDFDLSSIGSFGTVGSLMGGFSACTKDDACPVHNDLRDCDGELYENGTVSDMDGITKAIMKNLVNLSILELADFEFDSVFDGVYLGDAFGYEMSSLSDECEENCDIVHEHKYYSFCKPNCQLNHPEHNFHFTNGVEYVGDMLNKICNYTFDDVTSGNFDIQGIIDDTTIGEVMGYKLVDGEWLNENDEPVDRSDLTGKIFYQLYDKRVAELGSVQFETMVDGIFLGEVLGYVKCTANEDSCPVHTELCQQTEPYWYSGSERVSVMYNALSSVELSELSTNPNVIQDTLSTLYVGDLMGYTKSGSVWFKEGVEISALDAVLADIGLGSIFNGEFNLQSKIDDIKISDIVDVEGNAILSLVGDSTVSNLPSRLQGLYVGEIMGYTKSGDVWYDKSNNVLDGINLKLAKLTVQKLSDGGFDTIIDDIVVSDVISDYKSGAFSVIDASGLTDLNEDGIVDQGDAPVKDLADIIASSAKDATYGKLEDAGILQFDDDVLLGLNTFYEGKGLPNWKYEKTVNDILNDLIKNSLS